MCTNSEQLAKAIFASTIVNPEKIIPKRPPFQSDKKPKIGCAIVSPKMLNEKLKGNSQLLKKKRRTNKHNINM